jgi:hypothetical protein
MKRNVTLQVAYYEDLDHCNVDMNGSYTNPNYLECGLKENEYYVYEENSILVEL